MKERLLKYVKYLPFVGYPLFYLLCLGVFAVLTFPYDKLKQRIVGTYNAEQRGTGTPQELQIDEMSGHWLTGVRVRGVRLLTAATEPSKPPTKIELDEATVSYSLLSALIGNTGIGFDVFAFGGEASGSYDVRGKDKSLDVTLDAIDLGELEPLGALLGIPIQGKLGGKVSLLLPDGKPGKASGAVALEATGLTVGDGKAKIKGAFALPKLDVGTLTLTGDAKDGVLKITKLAATGRDVELDGDGRITIREGFGDSLCDAQVRFKINDAYRNKNDLTKSLFGAPGSTAPALFELADPKIKQAKRSDGFYGFTVRNALSRLDFIPAGGGAVGGMGFTGAPATPTIGTPFGAPGKGISR